MIVVRNAVRDSQPLGISPLDFPDLLRWTPYGAKALRAFAQVRFVPGDANDDDVVVASARPRPNPWA
jgi:hypothetical protein